MSLSIFHLDAFANQPFHGNPAAVIPLESWPSDEFLQDIAAENNLAETAFFVPKEGGYEIRWFTPSVEVDLCGHATIASAAVIFEILGYDKSVIEFDSKSGILKVEKKDDWYILDFPLDTYQIAVPPPALTEALSPVVPEEVYKGKSDYMVVLANETEVRELKPDILILSTIPTRGVIVTAKGDEVDFVSRFFAPQSGIDEDPVTGSSHTTLIPYWAKVLGKNELMAKQLSKRGGALKCSLAGDRVLIGGQIKLFSKGEIFL